MRRIRTFLKSQRGQNLALVAGSLLMLFALLMVAVDMGNIYLFRRGLQNSADAAALAGAQNLCFDEGTYDTAYAAAQTYAETYNMGEAGESDIDVDMAEYSVTVTTWDRADNLLVAGIVLGDNGTDIGATAKAACGPTTAPCNLFPVAFPLEQWDYMRDRCGEVFYVWAGDMDDRSNGGQQPNCEPYDAATNPDACNCDVDDDGDDDVIAENGRAWVDFTSSVNYEELQELYPDACGQSNGCGTQELKCWIENDSPTPFQIPQWVSGTNGVRAGTQNEIQARANRTPPGNIISVPIFDQSSTATFEDCQNSYHIVELGCMSLEGWDHNVRLRYVDPNANGWCWNGKLIEVAVSCGFCNSECGGTLGGPPVPGGVNAVSLIE